MLFLIVQGAASFVTRFSSSISYLFPSVFRLPLVSDSEAEEGPLARATHLEALLGF